MSELTNQMIANTIFLGLGGIRMWTDGYEHIHVFDPEKETDTLAIPLEWQRTSAKVMINGSASEYMGTTTVVYALESSQEKHPYVLLKVSTQLEADAVKKAVETAIAEHGEDYDYDQPHTSDDGFVVPDEHPLIYDSNDDDAIPELVDRCAN